MKIKITTTKEVIIGLPTFTKNDYSFYAIIEKDVCVRVSHYRNAQETTICMKVSPSMAFDEGYQLITGDEFFANYELTIKRLSSEMEGVFDICDKMHKEDVEIKSFIAELENDTKEDRYSSDEEEGMGDD